jgi:hypothetical protein
VQALSPAGRLAYLLTALTSHRGCIFRIQVY